MSTAAVDDDVALYRRAAGGRGTEEEDDDDFTDDDDDDGEEFEGDDDEEERQLRVLDDEEDEDEDEEGLVEDASDDEEEYDDEDDGGEELAGLERGARGIGLSPEQRQQLMQQQREQQQREQQQQPGQQGKNGGPRPPAPLAPREWAGLAGMPEPTRDRVEDALERFAQAAAAAAAAAAQTASSGPNSAPTLTVLVLGTPGAGKSATTNSLLNERVARVSPLQSEAARPVLAARRPPGGSPAVTVAVIDTPSLVASAEFGDDDAGGGVSLAAAGALGNALSGRPIDAVLFVDRLDGPPLGAFELALAKAYTSAFGAGIWDKATLVLSHGRLNCPPGGFASTDDYAAARAAELRAVLRRAGAAPSTAPLPALLADNGSRCARNEAEEPVLLDGEAWVPAVWEAIVDSALHSPSSPGGAAAAAVAPFVPDAAKARKAADPDRRRLWLVPVLLAAQLALRWFLVERVIADDGCRGDREGPFPSAVARARLQAKREERKRKKGSGGGGGRSGGGGGGGKGAGAGKKSGGGGGGDAAAALQRRKRAAAAAAAAKRKRAAGGA